MHRQEFDAFGRSDSDGTRQKLSSSRPAIFLVLLINVSVGHASDVIAYDSRARLGFAFCFFQVTGGELFRPLHPEIKELGNDALRIFFFGLERRAIIQIPM